MSAGPRFVVVGAGAIGAYVGAALARGGADVTLIARGEHLEAMQRDGVQVLSPRGDFHVEVHATDDFDAIAGAGVVILAVKSDSLRELAPAIGARLAPRAAVIAHRTGSLVVHALARSPRSTDRTRERRPRRRHAAAIPPSSVVGCVTYCSTEIEAPGVIRHIEGTRYYHRRAVGVDAAERCAPISEAFQAGGLKCPVEDDLGEQIWLKLVGNVSFNTVADAHRLHARGARLAAGVERAAAGRCSRSRPTSRTRSAYSLPVSIERRLERGLAVGPHKPSTLQDLEAGKPLEFDCLTGAVVELAGQLVLRVPLTRAVHACVQLLDARRQNWAAPSMPQRAAVRS